jgi:hypothetical protein
MESYIPVYMFTYNVIFHMLFTLLIISNNCFMSFIFEYAEHFWPFTSYFG